jgi:hypothetical protein
MGAGGMQQAGSARSGADGKFRIDTATPQAHILQAQYQGVSYNVQVPPNAAGGVTIEVFETRPKVSAMDFEQHMVLLETDGQQLVVNETIVVNNDSQTTWYDPNSGTLRFFTPPAIKGTDDLKVRVLAQGSVPVERVPKRGGAGVWFLDVPVKPGQTRFDISYRLPAATPARFQGRILHEPGPVRLVVPQGITVKGDQIASLGVEPQTQAQIFDVKSQAYEVTLEGTGSLRDASASAATEGAEETGPRIATILPPGYERQWKTVLALVVAALVLGFWSMYLKGNAPENRPSSGGGRRKA